MNVLANLGALLAAISLTLFGFNTLSTNALGIAGLFLTALFLAPAMAAALR